MKWWRQSGKMVFETVEAKKIKEKKNMKLHEAVAAKDGKYMGNRSEEHR